MRVSSSDPAIIASANIREYFQSSVETALQHQHTVAHPETVCYVANVLTAFARAEHLFDRDDDGRGTIPLASLYGAAVNADNREQRNHNLKRLGDIALFIAGLFADSLNRKLVDIDYYIAMGGNAYSYLSDDLSNSPSARTHVLVFGELAAKFTRFVDALAAVAEQRDVNRDVDIMRLYEVWLRSGSERARGRLNELGIAVADANVSRVQH